MRGSQKPRLPKRSQTQRSFARTWLNELKGRNIRVNVLSPGAGRHTGFPATRQGDEGEPRVGFATLFRHLTENAQAVQLLVRNTASVDTHNTKELPQIMSRPRACQIDHRQGATQHKRTIACQFDSYSLSRPDAGNRRFRASTPSDRAFCHRAGGPAWPNCRRHPMSYGRYAGGNGLRIWNCLWCQYGYGISGWLAWSSVATCWGVSTKARRNQIVAQLLLVARANDHAGDAGLSEQPVQSQLRDALARFGRQRVERVHYFVKILIRNPRALLGGFVQAALFRQGLPATDLSGEPSPTQRTPHQRAHAFSQRQRHQLPLIVAAHQRVIDLVSGVSRPAILPADLQRLLQMPTREIRGGNITQLAIADRVDPV